MDEAMLMRLQPEPLSVARAQRPEISGWVRLVQVGVFLLSVIAIGWILMQ